MSQVSCFILFLLYYSLSLFLVDSKLNCICLFFSFSIKYNYHDYNAHSRSRSSLALLQSKSDDCHDPSLPPCHLLPSCYSHWSHFARDPSIRRTRTTTSCDVESIAVQRCNSEPFVKFRIWRNDVAVETSMMGEQYEDDRTRYSSRSFDGVREHWLPHGGSSRLEPLPVLWCSLVCRSTRSPSFLCSSYWCWNVVSVCPSCE